MQKFKILDEHFEKDPKTGTFIRVVEVNPENGGKSTIIKLTIDSGVPFNTLSNGYHEVKE